MEIGSQQEAEDRQRSKNRRVGKSEKVQMHEQGNVKKSSSQKSRKQVGKTDIRLTRCSTKRTLCTVTAKGNLTAKWEHGHRNNL